MEVGKSTARQIQVVACMNSQAPFSAELISWCSEIHSFSQGSWLPVLVRFHGFVSQNSFLAYLLGGRVMMIVAMVGMMHGPLLEGLGHVAIKEVSRIHV